MQPIRTSSISAPPVVTPPVITPPVVVPPIVQPPVVTPPVVVPGSPTALINLAGKSQGAKADSNSFNGGNVPNMANDESASSFWESGSTPDDSGGERLIINFNKSVTLNTVILKVSAAGYPKAFRLMAVLNNKWTQVAEFKDGKVKGNTNVLESLTLSFNAITTTSIRIEFLDVVKKGDLVRIYEIEAYKK